MLQGLIKGKQRGDRTAFWVKNKKPIINNQGIDLNRLNQDLQVARSPFFDGTPLPNVWWSGNSALGGGLNATGTTMRQQAMSFMGATAL